MIRTIEELSMNAWPAIRTVLYDGWVLRFAQGYTRRANSINPLYPTRLELDEKLAFCEQLYRGEGLSVIYKLTQAMEPASLDEALAGKGYLLDASTSVQTLDLTETGERSTAGISFSPALTDAWLASYTSLAGIAAQQQPALHQILLGILQTSALRPSRWATRPSPAGWASSRAPGWGCSISSPRPNGAIRATAGNW